MKKVRIGIDLDGTLAQYQKSLLKFHNSRYSSSLRFNNLMRDDGYDILGRNPASRALKLGRFYLHSKSLTSIKPTKGSNKAIRQLKNEGYELFIVTSRFRGFSKPTQRWLDHSFGKNIFYKVIFSNLLSSYSSKFKARKYKKSNADIVIEDSPEVASMCARKGMKVILLDFPWNRNFKHKDITRVKDWNAALKVINKIQK